MARLSRLSRLSRLAPRAIGLTALLAVLTILAVPAVGAQTQPRSAFDRFLGSPATSAGRAIAVTGRVTATGEIVGYPALLLDDPRTSADEQLLVVARRGLSATIGAMSPGEVVHVEGTVRAFDPTVLQTLTRQAGVRLDPSVAQSLLGRPALFARSLSRAPSRSSGPTGTVPQVGAADQQRPRARAFSGSSLTGLATDPVLRVTPSELLIDLRPFGDRAIAGRTVMLAGQVTDVLNPYAVAVDNTIVVVSALAIASPAPAPSGNVSRNRSRQSPVPPDMRGSSLRVGDHVLVTGTARVFDPEAFSAALGVPFRGRAFEFWESRPAVVVQSLRAIPADVTASVPFPR